MKDNVFMVSYFDFLNITLRTLQMGLLPPPKNINYIDVREMQLIVKDIMNDEKVNSLDADSQVEMLLEKIVINDYPFSRQKLFNQYVLQVKRVYIWVQQKYKFSFAGTTS